MTRFFNITISSIARNNHFFDSAKKFLFPLYWQQVPCRYGEHLKSLLTKEELSDLAYLETLPQQLLAKAIVTLLKSINLVRDLKG